jgi:preprotein translocase subunit SecA
VEEQHYLQRKHTLEYDDVLNQQREVIYTYRDEVLEGRDMGDVAREELASLLERLVAEYTAGDFVEDWDVSGLLVRMQEIFDPSEEIMSIDPNRVDREELTEALQDEALAQYDLREEELGSELMREIERLLLLQIIDQRWREHLYDMDYLREGIHLRGFAQIEPLVAYKNEAFTLFSDLMNTVWSDFTRMIFHVQVVLQGPDGMPMEPPPQHRPSAAASSPTGGGRVTYSGGAGLAAGAQAIAAAAAADGGDGVPAGTPGGGGPMAAGAAMAAGQAGQYAAEPIAVEQRRVDVEPGRNDPCWCGSGKKYKKCHGT